MKRFSLYLLRWQASSVILYPIIAFLPVAPLWQAIIANLIGGCIFFPIDKLIFKKKAKRY